MVLMTTPEGHTDGYSDWNRPHRFRATFLINRQYVLHEWHSYGQGWAVVASLPAVSVLPASPPGAYVSPPGPSSLPGHLSVAGMNQLTSPSFPHARDVGMAYGQLSAKQLLDYPLPYIAVIGLEDGVVSPSSRINRHFAYINHLDEWPLPEDLSLYSNLPTDAAYYPPNEDGSLAANVESDAIAAMRHYIIGPVNVVLRNRFTSYNILCKSENSSVVEAQIHHVRRKVISRVDLCWQLTLANVTRTFAVLEFKRPGSIQGDQWSVALNGQAVSGSARSICQQLCKYGNAIGLRKVAACDLNTMVLLNLKGRSADWVGAVENQTTVNASCRWIVDKNEMKRHLFVFLISAASELLETMGMVLGAG